MNLLFFQFLLTEGKQQIVILTTLGGKIQFLLTEGKQKV